MQFPFALHLASILAIFLVHHTFLNLTILKILADLYIGLAIKFRY
jgi:hypothetical protein